jgi:23S rRNA (guanine2445-N2)-methyltransferase / 23S rRNA (guanine2069-N7)-methyltransferase
MSEPRFFATAARHLETLLAEEIAGLGVAPVAETRAGVRFGTTLADAYRVCLWSRVANRVLLPLAQFPAASPEALYAGVRALPWEGQLAPTATFAVHLDTARSAITHSRFGTLRVKDAIADRFREAFGLRPNVRVERPDIQVQVYLFRDEATVSIDLSGASLHRRGYREEGAAAPLKENLAAAILMRAGWPELAAQGAALVDPMCGSGTLPIEAALMAADIAPGLARTYWGFSGWLGHDAPAWEALLAEARERRTAGLERLGPGAQGGASVPGGTTPGMEAAEPRLAAKDGGHAGGAGAAPGEERRPRSREGRIRGYDLDPAAIRVALSNLERAGLAGRVHFERRDIDEAAPGRAGDQGLVAINPPYGERLGADSDLPALYARIGAMLRERFPGWRAALFTGNPDLGKHMGLRARRTHSLFNGPIACRLLHFEMTPEWFVSNRPRPLPVAERSPGALMLANRLAKNLKHLAKWRRREGVTCYRLYDADLPEYALAVDVYEGERRFVHAQEYEAPATIDPRQARLRLREGLGVIQEVLEVPDGQIFFKVRREQKGKAQYERLADSGHFHEVREGNCRLLVNFEDYLDTGLFLDNRPTRRMLGALARGRRFLNLFAYTGAASVHAARGGALSTTSVDLSRTYLDWAARNLALNGFAPPWAELIQADCLQWVCDNARRRRFGLIFLDPPTFSTSKRMDGTFDVQRDHVDLIRDTLELLEPDGILIFSNNLRRFRMEAGDLPGVRVTDISRATLPPDFERNPRIHNCWRIARGVATRA